MEQSTLEHHLSDTDSQEGRMMPAWLQSLIPVCTTNGRATASQQDTSRITHEELPTSNNKYLADANRSQIAPVALAGTIHLQRNP